MQIKSFIVAASLSVVALTAPVAGFAQDTAKEAFAEIEETVGFVPSYFKVIPEHAVPGAWILTRDQELSADTALSPKVKSLINVAVAAQIPCQYCVFADSAAARAAGATEEEIKEAVAQAGLTRYWSAILNGMQVDFEAFKAEFGG